MNGLATLSLPGQDCTISNLTMDILSNHLLSTIEFAFCYFSVPTRNKPDDIYIYIYRAYNFKLALMSSSIREMGDSSICLY